MKLTKVSLSLLLLTSLSGCAAVPYVVTAGLEWKRYQENAERAAREREQQALREAEVESLRAEIESLRAEVASQEEARRTWDEEEEARRGEEEALNKDKQVQLVAVQIKRLACARPRDLLAVIRGESSPGAARGPIQCPLSAWDTETGGMCVGCQHIEEGEEVVAVATQYDRELGQESGYVTVYSPLSGGGRGYEFKPLVARTEDVLPLPEEYAEGQDVLFAEFRQQMGIAPVASTQPE